MRLKYFLYHLPIFNSRDSYHKYKIILNVNETAISS